MKKENLPPNSPDLNPCDYFLWGYLKDKVYAKQITSIEILEKEIINEIEKIPKNMLSRVFENMRKRMKRVIEAKGGHIE